MDRTIAWKLALAFAVFSVLFLGLWVLGGFLLTTLLSRGGPEGPSSEFPDGRPARGEHPGEHAAPETGTGSGPPAVRPDPGVGALITRLSSSDYAERSAAEDALVSLGAAAVPELERALASADAEVRWRAKEALRRIQEK